MTLQNSMRQQASHTNHKPLLYNIPCFDWATSFGLYAQNDRAVFHETM